MGTKCCKTAPVPGETKIWQYITLTKRIYLIDCPGVVYNTGDDETETVLKGNYLLHLTITKIKLSIVGVVRAERLEDPADFVAPILERVKAEYIQRRYEVSGWEGHIDFLTKLALKSGRLGKGGEPDLKSVAVNVINDWQRGKLPYFVAPPKDEDDDAVDEEGENNENSDDPLITASDDGSSGENQKVLTYSMLFILFGDAWMIHCIR